MVITAAGSIQNKSALVKRNEGSSRDYHRNVGVFGSSVMILACTVCINADGSDNLLLSGEENMYGATQEWHRGDKVLYRAVQKGPCRT